MIRLQAVRGMHDILMQETPRWHYLEDTIKNILVQYGYQEIRLPVVEKTALFARSIGDSTDIVSREMYTFNDRNSDSLTLRPEGTAGCVRAGIEHGLFHNQTQRLWYMGPMFRHERPQKGRQRQFHQVGVETFGLAGPDIDAELIFICARLWQALHIGHVELQLNSLGTAETRAKYRHSLVDYFSGHREQLDEDSLIRLDKNPLRILDSKNPAMQHLIESAPNLLDYLDAESADHFAGLQDVLGSVGIKYKVNPRLVRGLDYYCKTVFEWVTPQFGAQGTICAGGRYDDLIESHGGSATSAVGFAIGLERLMESSRFDAMPDAYTPHVYLVMVGDEATRKGLLLAEQLRNRFRTIRIISHCGGGSFKNQFRKADKSGAKLALILGEHELGQGQVTIKYLRKDEPQRSLNQAEIVGFLAANLPNLEKLSS